MLCKMNFGHLSFILPGPTETLLPNKFLSYLNVFLWWRVCVRVCVCVPLNVIRVAAYISVGCYLLDPVQLISDNTNAENDSSCQPTIVCQLSLKKGCSLVSHSIFMMRH